MNYYEHHVGDYLKDTSRLSLVEHGAYTLLLADYYANEGPLPADFASLFRISRAFSRSEQAAVKSVAEKYFPIADDGLRHNRRADEEIAKFQAKSMHAKNAARIRWAAEADAKKEIDDATAYADAHATAYADAMRSDMPTQSPVTSNHKEQELESPDGDLSSEAKKPPPDDRPADLPAVGKLPKPEPPGPSPCPHQEIIALYHDILPELARVRDWTAPRRRLLQARWRESPERQNLDWWQTFFEYVRGCPWLMGNGAPSPGRQVFLANLEWLIRPSNFVKVIEGQYQERAA